jgi:hypothetical protein
MTERSSVETFVKNPFTVSLTLHRVSPLVGTPIIWCKILEKKKSSVNFVDSPFVKGACGALHLE